MFLKLKDKEKKAQRSLHLEKACLFPHQTKIMWPVPLPWEIYSLFSGHLFSYSETHRVVEGGRDLWRSAAPIPLLKQGPLDLLIFTVQLGED